MLEQGQAKDVTGIVRNLLKFPLLSVLISSDVVYVCDSVTIEIWYCSPAFDPFEHDLSG